MQIALDEGIEIHQDADLVQILKAVDIDSEIPLEAFGAVAEIISYIYKAKVSFIILATSLATSPSAKTGISLIFDTIIIKVKIKANILLKLNIC